jgi:CRP-like cAMP-binding protein
MSADMSILQATTGNFLLSKMAPDDYALIERHLRRIELPVRLQLHKAGGTIEDMYFPEGGVVSIVAVTHDGKACEVGLFGREGMSETATVMGTDCSPHEAYVQIAGASALKLSTSVMNAALANSSTLRLHLLKYVQAMIVQLSSSIVSSGQTIDQRLARWLLMCHDRGDDDLLHLTQEFIGMMLGVRRAGVTDAMAMLRNDGLIEQRRGTITIVDRKGLEQRAEGGYGLAEAEYKRLLGVALRRQPQAAHRSRRGQATEVAEQA